MKPLLKFIALVLLAGALVYVSCKKEYSCENCRDTNKPPVADAGKDTIIILPIDSTMLDGSASSDPDGTMSSFQWTKISGAPSLIINNASAAKTVVKNLSVGSYQFELKVTDNGGLSAKDTVQFTVNDPSQPNRPPVADAGADQTITLPTNTVNLDGSGSTDADNNIINYAWTKISGPSSFGFVNANAVQTQVANLVQGVYQFELKVTDDGGLFAKDTVHLTVNAATVIPACDNSNRPQVNAQLIPFGTLSQIRDGMAVASAGNKIVFAGGSSNNQLSSRVDIYDMATQTWSTAELSVARYDIAAVASGNKIFFGGGEIGDGTTPVNTVDIYDVSTNTWSASSLSGPGNGIAAAAVGNKVFFAGGDGGFTGPNRYNKVDIYDISTNTWSTALLSEGKAGPSAVTVNNKIYFAGGGTWLSNPNPNNGNFWIASDRIDIYDNATNSWSTSSLKEGKAGFAGIAVADKIYWAGGITGGTNTSVYTSCAVEISDVHTGSSSIQYLSKPGESLNAVVKDNKIIFFSQYGYGNNKFDIYDIATNTWSIAMLPINIGGGAPIISVNKTIYVAGGYVNGVLSNQVWKLEF